MNTIRVISSISFNTVPFFESVVNRLCRAGSAADGKQVLDWCHWIVHSPDSDQSKVHIHFVCKPSRRIDTNDLRKFFVEPVDALINERLARGEIKEVKPDDLKPLNCLPFNITQTMRDWLLYAIHDYHYLFQKGQSRTVHYKQEDVKSTEPEFLKSQFEECADPIQKLTQRVVDMYTLEQMTFSEIMMTNLIPPSLVYYFKTLVEGLGEPRTIRKKGGIQI